MRPETLLSVALHCQVMHFTRQKQYTPIQEYVLKTCRNACRGTLVCYFEVFPGHVERYCEKQADGENTHPTSAYSVQEKCIPQLYFVPVCLETDNFAFLLCLATGFHSVDLLIFQLVCSAKLPEYTCPIPGPGAGKRIAQNTKRGITAPEMLTLVFLMPFLFLH